VNKSDTWTGESVIDWEGEEFYIKETGKSYDIKVMLGKQKCYVEVKTSLGSKKNCSLSKAQKKFLKQKVMLSRCVLVMKVCGNGWLDGQEPSLTYEQMTL
jgi:hypothetical protein